MVDEAVAGAVAEAVAEDAPHQLLPEQRGACVWGGGGSGRGLTPRMAVAQASPPGRCCGVWTHHHQGPTTHQ